MLKDSLKHYRAKTGLSQAAVAKKLFISQAAYAKYEVGRSMPSTETLLKICDLFKCNLEDLLSDNEPVNNNLPGKYIPLFSQVAAGIPIEVNNYIDDETEYIEAALAKRGEYFALLIRGDSMEPLIHSGEVAIVRQRETIEDGEIGSVLSFRDHKVPEVHRGFCATYGIITVTRLLRDLIHACRRKTI